MADLGLRTAARAACALPSPEAEAAFLRARLRAGTLSSERLELAAYCNKFAARSLLTRCGDHGHDDDPDGGCRLVPDGQPHPAPIHEPGALCVYRDLSEFVAGLSRWGPTVQVRAAVAAARAALPIEHPCFGGPVHVHDATGGDHYGGDCDLALFAIEGAEKWLEDPTPKNLLAWRSAWFACEWEQAQWLPWVSSADYPQPSGPPTVADQASHIIRAGSLAGDAPVRAAIQSALISWALA